MKLAVVGGGGSRTPVLYAGLLAARDRLGLDDLVLHDVDDDALRRVGKVLDGLDEQDGTGLRRHATTDLEQGLQGADFVLAAVRAGGFEARRIDEEVALAHGVVGQETIGPGGFALALRNVPALRKVAAVMRRACPRAWLVNLTNPAGMVTQALAPLLHGRVVGVCDSPVALGRGAAAALGVAPEATHMAYAGLNHLGWLTGLWHDGRDLLPELLATPALARVEEARLLGVDDVRAQGALPNEYLWFYDRPARALDNIRAAGQPRGAFLLAQAQRLAAAVDAAATPAQALATFRDSLGTRTHTYLAVEAALERQPDDDAFAAAGGYHDMALSVVAALGSDRPAVLVVNTPNRGSLDFLDDDDVVEVPAAVSAAGVFPLAARVPDDRRELVRRVKAFENATLAALDAGSRGAARDAVASHPLVDSPRKAEAILDGYLRCLPQLAATLDRP